MTLNNIVLKHGYGQVFSRKNVNINICDKKGQIFDSPVILSNMPSVQNDIILKKFDKAYWPYVRHRIDGPEKIYDFVVQTNKEDWNHISISIGVQDSDLELIRKIKNEKLRVDWITIDVAFIYNRNYSHFIDDIRELIPSAYLIAGNFTNAHVLQWLKNLGVDAAKFGIGQSNLCRTRQYTGFGTTVQDLIECGNEAQRIGIDLINDSGLTIIDEEKGEVALGDIFKAINFGAKWQMSSSLFRWCPELANADGLIEQYGNSTARAKGFNRNQEGAIKLYKTNNITVEERFQQIKEALQSSVSYSGNTELYSCYNSCKYQII